MCACGCYGSCAHHWDRTVARGNEEMASDVTFTVASEDDLPVVNWNDLVVGDDSLDRDCDLGIILFLERMLFKY